MNLSKMEFIALLVALFVGLHFYNQYQLDHVDPANSDGIPLFASDENPPVIVAFGDSWTAGVGAGPGESYPDQLSEMLGVKVINAGRASELSRDGVGRIKQVLEQYHPTIVIIEEGANDLFHGKRRLLIAKNLITMIKTVRKYGAKPILIGFPDPDMIDLMISADVDLYEKVVQRTGVAYIPDVFGEVLRNEDLKSDDFIHPNAKGYRRVAEKIYQYFLENPL